MNMNERKVGVVTFRGNSNYGNRLQCYAVMQIWRGIGFAPEELYIAKVPGFMPAAKCLVKKLIHWQRSETNVDAKGKRLEAFVRFGEHIPSRMVDMRDRGLKDEYAYFSVGSDQVWKPGVRKSGKEDWYFLEFAQKSQRIALSPSVGISEFANTSQRRRLCKGVRNFEKLSVREKRGAELIKECSGLDATVICDPTLVLNAHDWEVVSDDRLVPPDPYVLAYVLGTSNGETSEAIKEAAGDSMRVVYLSDRQRPGEPDAGPAEFISLVMSASHVVTDSFHASVFASIFQRPLTIVHREGRSYSMFSRLEQLADMLGIEHKIYGSPEYDLSRAGDYEGVPEAIEREREKFMAYLKGCLNA